MTAPPADSPPGSEARPPAASAGEKHSAGDRHPAGENQPAGEDALIHWLRERLGPGNLLGDDAALLPAPASATGAAPVAGRGAAGGQWVATVDSQVSGVHHPPGLDPALVARRLLAVNLSDLAAMGADPVYALLALTAAPGYDHRRLLDSLAAACAEAGVTLAGGDLASLERSPADRSAGAREPAAAAAAVASLTLLGTLPEDREPLRRGAARPGDALWVSGALGLSAAGRHLLARGARVEPAPSTPPPPGAPPVIPRDAAGAAAARWTWRPPPDLPSSLAPAARAALRHHLLPEPQLALGRALARAARRRGSPGAAMDLSDGLARDLPRLCRESGVGAEVVREALPRPAGLVGLAGWLGMEVGDLLLAGGEDYALLFTLPPDEPPPPGFRAARIGRMTEGTAGERGGPEVLLRSPEGVAPLPRGGWDHLDRSGER